MLALLASLIACVSTTQAAHMNVLFVVVDDLAPAFEAYNYPALAPNLDKLAQRSVQVRADHH